WLLRKAGETWLVVHGGDVPGANASMILVPERRFGVVVVATGDPECFTFCEHVTAEALKTHLGVEEAHPVTRSVDGRTLREYAGAYETTVMQIDLRSDDGGFVLSYGVKPGLVEDPPEIPPMRLRFYDEDKVLVLDGPYANIKGDFIRDPAGRIRWFRFAGRIAAPVPGSTASS